MLRAAAYLVEAANSRHEHEYHLWADVSSGVLKIPSDDL